MIVKSRYNNKQVEGITDDDGTLVLNIGDLAENPNNLEKLDSYAFNGSIEVIPNSGDYREFKVLLTRIEGGRGYRIPSRRITDDKPYPVSVSFDEWDVLYTSELNYEDDVSHDTDLSNKEGIRYFGLSSANKDDHTFVVIMKNLPSATAQVTMQLVERDSKRSILSRQVTARNGIAELRVAKKFLQEGSTDALPEKKPLDVWATIDGVKYTFPIRLQVEKTVFPKPEAVKNKVAKPLVTGGNATDTSGVKVTLPPSAPLGKKDEFSMWLPEFPINVYVDPTGYFQLTMRTPSWGYVNDNGNPEDNGWKKFPRDAVTKQIEKKKEEWDSILSKAGNAYSGEYGFVRQIDFSSTFKAYGFFQFMAVAQWDPKEGWFSGNAVGQFTMAMDYALSENFLMGPVPVLIEFAFKLSLTFSLGPGFIVVSDGRNLLDCVTDLSLYQWDYKGDDGKLMDVTPDGSLAPGKTSVFLMEVIIPEGWSGRKDLSFVTQNCEVVDGMIAAADDGDDSPYEILDYSVGPENGVSDFVLADECYWEAAFYDDAPVSVYGEGEVPGGNSGSGGASGGASSRGSASGAATGPRGGLARTGDTSNTALAAGMAAAGVALAAAGAHMRQQEDDE